MGTFSAEWLSLREPADRAARAIRLATRVAAALEGREARILDLAAGTGANVRALAEHLSPPQDWLLVDHDTALLGGVRDRMRSWAARSGFQVTEEPEVMLVRGPGVDCRLTTACRDLLSDTADLHAGRRLVTASALLDLVSPAWLRELAARCARHRAIVLFPLNYDGRLTCSPAEPEDETIRDLVNTHQRTDKGFGPACGPEAADVARRVLAEAGYDVDVERSDWVLEPDAAALQRPLIGGWADAASAMSPDQASAIDAWRRRRFEHVSAGRSRIIVGHVDVAGFMD